MRQCINKISSSILSFLLLSIHMYAQDIKMEDNIYDDEVSSVQVLVNDTITSIPMMKLNSTDILSLEFDDLADHEDNEYYYRIILCDKDWQKTNLDPIEYVDGFHEERLRDWQNAIGTFVPYTHYWMTIPNRDTRIKSSGNYVLYVYNRYDDETPVLTKRFIVTETLAGVKNQWSRPSITEIVRFGQQLNLDVVVDNFKMPNPQRDVSMTIVRNGDWHDAKSNIKCRSFFNNVFTFDKFGVTSFLGLTEYRAFDLRSMMGRGQGVMKLVKGPEMMEATLRTDQKRDEAVYLFNFDFNGNYYIDNRDDINRVLFTDGDVLAGTKSKINDFRKIFQNTNDGKTGNFAYFDNSANGWKVRDKSIRSDYVKVKFSLKSTNTDDKIYLYGALSNFKIDPRFEMKYDGTQEAYVIEKVLKQGYYNYMYATADKKGNPIFRNTEGSWQDTENDYRTIVYYREYGSRIDRVIGVNLFNSSQFDY